MEKSLELKLHPFNMEGILESNLMKERIKEFESNPLNPIEFAFLKGL